MNEPTQEKTKCITKANLPDNGMDVHLSQLFSTLNKNGTKYFLLTDFEGDFQSKDIDLFVHSNHKIKFEKTLHVLGWYKRKELPHHINHHFYYSPNLEVYLDVKFSLTFANGINKCCTLLCPDAVLSKSVLNSRGIYRPFGFDAILLYAAHLAFKERGKLERKHRSHLKSYINLYQVEFDNGSLQALEQMQHWLLNSFPENTQKLQQILKPYFESNQQKMVRDKSFSRCGYGLKVLFLGTDGAGKTTLINAVEEKLNFKSRKLYLGMGESGWTSRLSRGLFRYSIKTKYLRKLYNLFKNFVVLPSEFILRISPVKLRSKYTIVLIDRFPGTMLLNPSSNKTKLYRAILPQPDLVFFLYAAPEVLVARKPHESTLERSKKEIMKFKRVAHNVSDGNYIGIDTSHLTINEARDLIISEIYKHANVYSNLLTTT